MSRIVWSLLTLPIAVIALAVAYGVLSASSGGAIEAIGNLRYQALWYALVAYVVIGVLAVPALLVAWRKRWLRWWHSVLIGTLIGAIAFVLVLVPTLLDERLRLGYRFEQLAVLREFAAIGAVHGLLFWVLALWRNRATQLSS